jgi:hypothetical protein
LDEKAKVLSRICNRARKSIRIVVLDIKTDIYFDEKVVNALRRAIAKNVNVEIFCIFNPDAVSLDSDIASVVKVLRAMDFWRLKPCGTIDSKTCFFGEDWNRDTYVSRKGLVCHYAEILVKEYDRFIDSLIDISRPLDPGK